MTSFVLGNLPFPGQSGDQVVSKAVTTAIAALFKRTGKLDATVRAEPVAKLLQGSVDGFDFMGTSMLMYNGLRIESMELYLQAISLDFGAIFKGQINLRQPTQASMRVVLTEEDLTTSFNTNFIVDKLEQLEVDGKKLHFQDTTFALGQDKTCTVKTKVKAGDWAPTLDIEFVARLEVQERRKIQFVDVSYSGDETSVELSKAIIEHVNSLLDLDKFALQGTQLRVDRLRLRDKELVFYGTADIRQFPRKK
ncbi:LmeA family phospholipid-binding protein [Leptothoe spongobia]|uniref:DUF2993 domain-containing protein n=1 Tax=Leptothoe spongobia TAU-MAC 1115 TaxID=1967444 RepID=A0A947DDY0_9CYAN|nr:DUF2993 domain-containing protein [Leptothoe spongobia]MBT9315197.1 DUF2993 domain-containing protein [Leptothoe spongobia TAU-MAC 1115]